MMSSHGSNPPRPPSIGTLLSREDVQAALKRLPRAAVVDALRAEVRKEREKMLLGHPSRTEDQLAAEALAIARGASRGTLSRAINATGIVLHTGLGRAVLAAEAVRQVLEAAKGHCVLEIDRETGRRGSRQNHVNSLLRELTGAEAALVVNNNAAAVLLGVAALAAGKEVVLSRGQSVEIGGAFRMPDIVRAAGAVLVEVGTTNRTRLSDYERAVTDRTGLLLRCHPSNFRMVGFTEEVSGQDLAALGRARGIPVMDDLGSGALLPTQSLGTGPVQTLREAVGSGVDLVTASGDKLLGGPQAGILLGREPVIEAVARHPMARAVRCDKLTLAALEATLRLYHDPAVATRAVPTLRYLSRSKTDIQSLARSLVRRLRPLAELADVGLAAGYSQVGGGSLPGENLPTVLVQVRPQAISEERLARLLRHAEPPIFARTQDGAVVFDLRTVEPGEVAEIARAIQAALRGESRGRSATAVGAQTTEEGT
jgi:L-seryl-tRNA(Ser) seleniumtransferase